MENTVNPDNNALIEFLMRSHDDAAECRVEPVPEQRRADDRMMIPVFDGGEYVEPYEGMEFDSEEAARVFYNAYARRAGFGIRLSNNLRSKKDRRTIARKFVCFKEGFRAKKHLYNVNRVKKPRAITREGCGAMLMVKKTELGKWVVTKFIKEHNHPFLSPNEVMLLRSHRNASDTPKSRIKPSDGERMDRNRMMSIFGPEGSGINDAGYSGQDIGNHGQTGPKRKKNLGRDIENVLDYFRRMQSENPAFYYAIQVDEARASCSMFWSDARSRMACNYFGDVVYFDMIYEMNRYEMSVALFTGVNHHQRSVLFGCALLIDESEASFIWLFKEWLEAMCGHHPISIITDQDVNISAAIAEVFPETHHCYNKWQILNNAPKQLSHVYLTYPTFQREFEKCINLSETTEEFESCWEMLLDRYELRGNEWLQLLYSSRKKWVPVYLRGTFFGQMPTAPRNEIVNSFMDGYMSSNTNLLEFVSQMERRLETWYEKELEEDVLTMHAKPDLKTKFLIEKQVATVYTSRMFQKFQEEVFESVAYAANKIAEEGEVSTFRVAKYEDNHRRAHTVTLHVAERRAGCSCQMFEFLGFLCRHILKVFLISNITVLPHHYILGRWTRNAKDRDVFDERGVAIRPNTQESVTLRYNNLCKQAIRCVEEGATAGECYDVAVHALRAAWERIVASKERLARGAQLAGTPVSGSKRTDIIPMQSEAEDTTNCITLGDPRQFYPWHL